MMRALIITVACLCSILTLLWALLKPGFDSWAAFLASFVVFLSSFKIPKNEKIFNHLHKNRKFLITQ